MHNRTTALELPTPVRSRDEQGMSTAEYAVGTVGACGFGGVLIEVLRSEPVRNTLKSILMKALSFSGIG